MSNMFNKSGIFIKTRLNLAFISLILLAYVLLANTALSEADSSLKKKCEEKSAEVIDMIKESGVELTFKEINKRDGRFVWEDSFVYAIDIKKGIVLAHNNRRMIGDLVYGITNINGRKIYHEFMDKGERDGKGWVTYMWKNRLKYIQRHTYVMKVPGHDILILSSTYDKADESKDEKKTENVEPGQ